MSKTSLCSSRAFEGLLQVIELDLSNNNISTIPSDAFLGLVSLRTLDLSFNNLSKLDSKNGVLEPCLSLEKVSLKSHFFYSKKRMCLYKNRILLSSLQNMFEKYLQQFISCDKISIPFWIKCLENIKKI